MDYLISYKLWQWAKRRHRRKPKGWIRRQYYSQGDRWGVFRGKEPTDQGTIREIKLERAREEKIKRHCLIKGASNPYAQEWKQYFETRQQIRWKTTQKRASFLDMLWPSQTGKCPVCQQAISQESKWKQHHILPKSEGGTDEEKNLLLLHPTCHKQVHSNPSVARSVRKRQANRGLSEVQGNLHASFLGEGAAATLPPYPTR